MKAPDIVNDLQEGATKAVRLPDGRFVTEALAKKFTLGDMVFEKALESYREKLQELPPPPPGYYYAPKIGEIRYDGGQFFVEGHLSLEPIIKGETR